MKNNRRLYEALGQMPERLDDFSQLQQTVQQMWTNIRNRSALTVPIDRCVLAAMMFDSSAFRSLLVTAPADSTRFVNIVNAAQLAYNQAAAPNPTRAALFSIIQNNYVNLT